MISRPAHGMLINSFCKFALVLDGRPLDFDAITDEEIREFRQESRRKCEQFAEEKAITRVVSPYIHKHGHHYHKPLHSCF